jgi:hypothetical protein
MEIVKPQQGTTWTSILTGMQVGEKLPASIKDRSTVSPLISGHLKRTNPNMAWETKKKDEKTFNIIRTK